MLMKVEEIAKIKTKSEYDDDTDDWVVPQFKLAAKEVSLPTLGMGRKGYDMMEQEKENRELAIDGGDEGSDDEEGYSQQKKGGGLFSKNAANGVRSS